MEGMWTRFQPAVIKLNSLLNEKRIGEIKLIHGSFCFSADYDPAHRLFDLELGGGALLDVGIYPISLMIMILGRPSKIHSFVHIGDSGVDESASVIFQFDGNVSSTLNFSIRSAAPNEFVVMGTDGYIKLHSPIYRPDKMTVSDKYGNEELLEFNIRGKGFIYEIEELNRCFREGLAESPVMQHRESYRIMKVLDTIRKQWMLSYPND
jgi:predicted dehydrogenase